MAVDKAPRTRTENRLIVTSVGWSHSVRSRGQLFGSSRVTSHAWQALPKRGGRRSTDAHCRVLQLEHCVFLAFEAQLTRTQAFVAALLAAVSHGCSRQSKARPGRRRPAFLCSTRGTSTAVAM